MNMRVKEMIADVLTEKKCMRRMELIHEIASRSGLDIKRVQWAVFDMDKAGEIVGTLVGKTKHYALNEKDLKLAGGFFTKPDTSKKEVASHKATKKEVTKPVTTSIEKPEATTKEIGDVESLVNVDTVFNMPALVKEVAKYLPKTETAKEATPVDMDKLIKEVAKELTVRHEIKVATAPAVKMENVQLPYYFDTLLAYCANNIPVMLTGPAGTGKGYTTRLAAKALNADFYEVNAVQNAYELTGFVDAHSRFVETPFYNACKNADAGKPTVFLFDEMDCSVPEVLKIFNEALASKEFTFPNNEKLNFENLIVVAACNTYGTGADSMYVGNQLDASTLDRFALLDVDYDKEIEKSITGGNNELCNFFDDFRQACNVAGVGFISSYRSLARIAKMEKVLPLQQVLTQCYLKAMPKDDIATVLKQMASTDNKYYNACKELAA